MGLKARVYNTFFVIGEMYGCWARNEDYVIGGMSRRNFYVCGAKMRLKNGNMNDDFNVFLIGCVAGPSVEP